MKVTDTSILSILAFLIWKFCNNFFSQILFSFIWRIAKSQTHSYKNYCQYTKYYIKTARFCTSVSFNNYQVWWWRTRAATIIFTNCILWSSRHTPLSSLLRIAKPCGWFSRGDRTVQNWCWNKSMCIQTQITTFYYVINFWWHFPKTEW